MYLHLRLHHHPDHLYSLMLLLLPFPFVVLSDDRLELLPRASGLMRNSDCHQLGQIKAESPCLSVLSSHPHMGVLPRKRNSLCSSKAELYRL